MQLSKHIGKAVWSTADKGLYLLIGLAFIFPQKIIGENNWGLYTLAQALLTPLYMLSDGLSLQAMVNFGMQPEKRAQALTFSALAHLFFIVTCTAIIYFGRTLIASFFGKPEFADVLVLFPIVSGGFLLRNFFLKVSQLHIDTRATFFIDLAWIGSTVGLILWNWKKGALVTAQDMMIISAWASGISSLVGLILFGRSLTFTTKVDAAYFRSMMRFGFTQFGSAATIALQTNGATLLLGRFVSTATVGNYDAASKIFRGFEALRDAGSLFVYPAVARLHSQKRDKEMVLLVEKMIGFMLIVIIPLVVFVWVGPTDALFQLVYKGNYRQAPEIFKVLSIAALAIPFSMNLNVLNGLGEARRTFRVTLISGGGFFLAALVLIPPFQAIGAALTIIVSYILLAIFSTRAVKERVPFSYSGAFGRWRDALDFAARMWHKTRAPRVVRKPTAIPKAKDPVK